MTTSSYHHGDLKARLIARAVEVISENGVEALSLRQLAKDLNVSHSAPSRHYSSKTDLLSAVAAHGFSQMMVATRGANSVEIKEPLDALRAMAKANINWAIKNPMLYMAMRNMDVTRHADDNLKEKLQEFTSKQRGAIEAAQRAGWNAQIDAKLLHVQIVSILTGISVTLCDPLYQAVVGFKDQQKFIDDSIDLMLAQR